MGLINEQINKTERERKKCFIKLYNKQRGKTSNVEEVQKRVEEMTEIIKKLYENFLKKYGCFIDTHEISIAENMAMRELTKKIIKTQQRGR